MFIPASGPADIIFILDIGVIIALIFGIASVISSIFFGWIPSRNREKISRLEGKLNKANNNISFFVEEEKILLQALSEKENRSADSIKVEIRKKVSETTGKRLDDSYRPSHY